MSAEQAAPTSSLGDKVLRGGKYLAAGTVLERLARLGRNMLLARVIAPDQFAIMAITLATIALFEALTEVGVAQAVIQNKRGDTPEFLNAAWWFGVARGLVVAVLAVLLASPIASFYGHPELDVLLTVAPLSVVLSGLTSPRIYALQKHFQYRATLVTMQGAGLLGTGVTIVLGFLLQNVWALLWGAVFEAFARFVLSFLLCPIRPRLRLDPESRRDLFKFSKGMAGLAVLNLLLLQADTFVLGKVIPPAELGYYSLAIALAMFPQSIFAKVVQPLVVPILTRFVDSDSRLTETFLRISRLVWLFGLPLTAIMAVTAGPLLRVIYGPEYVQAGPAFAAYSCFAIVYIASMVSFSVYLAIARPELQRTVTLVRTVVLVVALYPLAVQLGGTGAALTLLIAMSLAKLVQLFLLRRVIGLRITAYLAAMRAGLAIAVAVGAVCFAIVYLAPLVPWALVLLNGAVGALTWGAILWRERRGLRQFRTRAAGEPLSEPPGPRSTDGATP